MAEFCECGSLIIDGRCSNKSCIRSGSGSSKPTKKASASVRSAVKGTATETPVSKKANPRRASKVITYNLYDTKKNKDEEPEK